MQYYKYINTYKISQGGVASPNFWGGAKMFDFKRITLFCLGDHLSKHKMIVCSKHFGGVWPGSPPWLRLYSPVTTGGLSPRNRASRPPNWNMKHYKVFVFNSPRANLKPSHIEDFLATVLRLRWRRIDFLPVKSALRVTLLIVIRITFWS